MKQTRLDFFFESSHAAPVSPAKKQRPKSRPKAPPLRTLDEFTAPPGPFASHFRLEVAERRLHFPGPERAARAPRDLTPSERDLANRYDSIDEPCFVPAFWERRVYDRPCDLMSDADSDTLRRILSDFSRYDGSPGPWRNAGRSKECVVRLPNRRKCPETPPNVKKSAKIRQGFVLE